MDKKAWVIQSVQDWMDQHNLKGWDANAIEILIESSIKDGLQNGTPVILPAPVPITLPITLVPAPMPVNLNPQEKK